MLVWVKEVLRDVLHRFTKVGTNTTAHRIRESVSIIDSELLAIQTHLPQLSFSLVLFSDKQQRDEQNKGNDLDALLSRGPGAESGAQLSSLTANFICYQTKFGRSGFDFQIKEGRNVSG